jgi:RNA polymerase sigma-70 factor (ECF subfamily)
VTSFGKLVEEQLPRLRRYALALLRDPDKADDLVQDTVLRALEKKHLYQPDTNLRAWLFTLLHNQHVNRVRQLVRQGPTANIDDIQAPAPATQMRRLELNDLDRAVARLPQDQRTVLLLIGLEGMKYDEVAEVLGVPVGTVRSRLSRARADLRVMLGEEPGASQSLPPRAERAARERRPARASQAASIGL